MESRICPDFLTHAYVICREMLLTPFVSKHLVNALCVVPLNVVIKIIF